MSDVVLRCPNCGTTQAASGECEACHEDSVRHFCPNHSPGRWLDGPTCAECGARESRERVAGRGRAVPPMPPMPPASRPPRAPTREPGREAPRSPTRDIPPFTPTRDIPPFDVPARHFPPEVPRPGTPRRGDSDDDSPFTYPEPPRDVTRDVTRGDEIGVPGWRVELPPGVSIRGLPSALGCLKKLLVLALIGAILFALASAWFFSSVFIGSRHDDIQRDIVARVVDGWSEWQGNSNGLPRVDTGTSG